MNLFAPAEFTENYAAVSVKKSKAPLSNLILLSILAGMLIAFAGAVTNTATHCMTDTGVIRMTSGLLFAFGLGMVVLSGAELFTGNCLMTIGLFDGRIKLGGLLRNLGVVLCGNFVGSMIVAAACAYFGQMNMSACGLAVSAMKIALAKSTMPFANALVQGIMCNVLVCLGVLFSLSAKDVCGRFLGAFAPVAFFVTIGFNHSIADMFYCTVGLFAKTVPAYAEAAAAAGVDLSGLTWGAYFGGNLLPVVLGNVLGGVAVAFVMWHCFLKKKKEA